MCYSCVFVARINKAALDNVVNVFWPQATCSLSSPRATGIVDSMCGPTSVSCPFYEHRVVKKTYIYSANTPYGSQIGAHGSKARILI